MQNDKTVNQDTDTNATATTAESRPQDNPISWKNIFVDMLGAAVNFDAAFLRTFKGLLLHPGDTLRRFFGDNNESFSNPVGFIMFAGAVYALAYTIFPHEVGLTYQPADPNSVFQNVLEPFLNNLVLMEFVKVLVFEFFPFYWAFHRTTEGRRYSKPQLYVVLMFISAMFFSLRTLTAPLTAYLPATSIALGLTELAYQIYFFKTFFRISLLATLLRVALQMIYLIVLVSLVALVATIVVQIFGQMGESHEIFNIFGFLLDSEFSGSAHFYHPPATIQ